MVNSQVETVNTGANRAKSALAVLLVLGGFAAYYLLEKNGQLAQWAGLLGSIVVAVVVFFTSQSGRDLFAFGRDTQREVKKVVWPERKEAIQMTAYVFGFVLLMALFLWLTDKTLEWFFYDLILGWKK